MQRCCFSSYLHKVNINCRFFKSRFFERRAKKKRPKRLSGFQKTRSFRPTPNPVADVGIRGSLASKSVVILLLLYCASDIAAMNASLLSLYIFNCVAIVAFWALITYKFTAFCMSTAACHELIERMNESDGHTPGLYGTVLYNTQPEEWLHNNGGHGRGHFSMVWYGTEGSSLCLHRKKRTFHVGWKW